MKAVMISIQPKWCELIASGEKTIEVRKIYPKKMLEAYYIKQSDFFRNRPSYRVKPFKCYIYCTKGATGLYKIGDCIMAEKISEIQVIPTHSGKVIGEFICDSILDIPSYVGSYEDCQDYDISDNDLAKTCLGLGDLFNYGRGKPLYGWHISDLVIYDKPKKLCAFKKVGKCDLEFKEKNMGICKRIHCKNYNGDFSCCDVRYGDCLTKPFQSWGYVEELTNETLRDMRQRN